MSLIEDYWGRLDARRRFGLLSGVLLIAAVVTLLCIWVFKTDYAVLFSRLSDADAAAITAELDNLKIPYRLGEGGSAVLVDGERVHEARLKLTGSGVLVKGGVGFELFDNAEYGMTDFAQKINYQRALQGELARTIMSIAEVRQARVHLVLPESSLFRRDRQRDVSASISVVTAAGAPLKREQILGVQRLVAAAVKDLEYREVVITDQNGVVLTANPSEDEGAISGRLDKKKKIEDYLTRKVRRILDRVFGAGEGVVNVDVTINYDQVERQVEEVVPSAANDSRGVVSRRVDTTVRKSDAAAGRNNDTGANPGGGSDNLLNQSREVEYKLGKAVERVIHSVGDITGISASVLVPPTATGAEIEALRGLIRTALGVKEIRGDNIEIQPIASKRPDSFASPATSAPEPLMSKVGISETGLSTAGLSTSEIAEIPINAPGTISASQQSPGARTSGAPAWGYTGAGPGNQRGIRAWLGDRGDYPPAVVALTVAAVLALAFALIFAVFRPAGSGRKQRLDAEGREAVLLELKNWLNGEGGARRDYLAIAEGEKAIAEERKAIAGEKP